MGVFLRQAGDFLVVVCDFNAVNLEWVMTLILIGVALYTILGGMLSVLITDYIQFIMLSLGLIIVIFLVVTQFGWYLFFCRICQRSNFGRKWNSKC